MQRRGFVGACASIATAGHLPAALAAAPMRLYQRVQLSREDGTPLTASSLRMGESYVFNYPFVTTPCFLLELGRPLRHEQPLTTEDGAHYTWPGGVGPGHSLVAFSAICAHKLTHPSRDISFINYRHAPVSFRDGKQSLIRRAGVILCCSERSAYDPARGAAVLGGPARQPLCTILLEHDAASDHLYALGSQGGEMFSRFFELFSVRLQLEWGISDVRQPVTDSTTVLPIERYSRNLRSCGA